MYQSQFGLSRRPYSSTPDPTCVVPVGGMPEAISELEHCAQDGQGFGILTAPAGLGKTILCRKLAESLRDHFAVVFLPNANFPTRRSLLQAVLYEMGHPYLRLGEQELRLEFTTAVRDLHPDRDGLVVIVDEAHLLHNRLLEELRTATHLVHQGEMLVRVILSGQLDLEERLVKKDMAAINQRIVSHVTLSSLTMLESQEYLQQRIEWAGGALFDIFTADAVRMICQASDGNPRCLNQLADHALLLAAAEKHPQAETTHVLEALEELKQLPLHWNHVETPKPSSGVSSQSVELVSEFQKPTAEDDEDSETAFIEFGAPLKQEQTQPVEAEFAHSEQGAVDTEIGAMVDENDTKCGEVQSDDLHDEAEVAAECETENIREEEAGVLELGEFEPESTEEENVEDSALETSTTDANIGLDTTHDFAEEAVQDHYSQLEKGLPPEIVQQKPRDWETWDPVEELRTEEAAFAAPPFPAVEPEITIINAIPELGEEWQPEDLNRSHRQPVTSDPSELIDRVMPLIDAALDSGGDFTELDDLIESDPQSNFLKDFTTSASKPTVSDSLGEPFLAEASLAGDWDQTDGLDEMVSLMNQELPLDIGNSSEESHEYLTIPQSESSLQDIEEKIAQTVLDTYNDVQPLIWNSTTETEADAKTEPPPVSPGEEPILEPGDSTPFDELRETLQQAVEATTEPVSELVEQSESPTPANEDQTTKPHPTQVEYDVVLPEPEEESQVSSRGSGGPQQPYSTRNLFSRIRRKEQA